MLQQGSSNKECCRLPKFLEVRIPDAPDCAMQSVLSCIADRRTVDCLLEVVCASEWASATPDVVALIAPVIRAMVDSPDSVQIHVREVDGLETISVHVSPRDLGKLVGINGRTARALRLLISVIGKAQNRRFNLSLEPTLPV